MTAHRCPPPCPDPDDHVMAAQALASLAVGLASGALVGLLLGLAAGWALWH